jgi:hypothetical protein
MSVIKFENYSKYLKCNERSLLNFRWFYEFSYSLDVLDLEVDRKIKNPNGQKLDDWCKNREPLTNKELKEIDKRMKSCIEELNIIDFFLERLHANEKNTKQGKK